MAYSATYSSGDLDDIVIDFLGQFGVTVIAFAALIALVALYRWYQGKKI